MGGEEPIPGEMFAGYRVVRRLNSGDLRVADPVGQPSLKKQLAITVPPADRTAGPDFLLRWPREMLTAFPLDHPCFLAAVDASLADTPLWHPMTADPGTDATDRGRDHGVPGSADPPEAIHLPAGRCRVGSAPDRGGADDDPVLLTHAHAVR